MALLSILLHRLFDHITRVPTVECRFCFTVIFTVVQRCMYSNTAVLCFFRGRSIYISSLYSIHFLGPCDSLPCKNKGICSSSDGGSFVCECTAEYQGETCEGTIAAMILTLVA